jgi:hypothetical protein
MKRAVEGNLAVKDNENFDGIKDGREHLELLLRAKVFKRHSRKQRFSSPPQLDNILTKLYLAL